MISKHSSIFYPSILFLFISTTQFTLNAQTYLVEWESAINLNFVGDSISTTVEGFDNSFGESKNVLPSGQDGWVEFTVVSPNRDYFVGLSVPDREPSYLNIESAVYDRSPTHIQAYEDGAERTLTSESFVTGDIIRIERVGSTVYYKRNGTTLGTNAASTGDLVINISFRFENGYIRNLVASFPPPDGGTPTDDCEIDPTAGTLGLHIGSDGTVKVDNFLYAREILVTMCPFPDYVFARNYDLMPLDDLKKYIEKYQHLPNIPSAQTVREENIGLGELSRKQMEKIEELTLYMIQMNDRMRKLEVENERLRKALDAKED